MTTMKKKPLSRTVRDERIRKIRELQGLCVDVGNSHANCLLAFLRDIDIHYWDHEGTHEEQLANCQFSRQIFMVPALIWYLEHVIGLYGYCDFFVHDESIPKTPQKRRRKMAVLFKRFSKDMYEILGSKPAENFVRCDFHYFTNSPNKESGKEYGGLGYGDQKKGNEKTDQKTAAYEKSRRRTDSEIERVSSSLRLEGV